jgi:uncharacterized protein with NRDE domain
MCLLAIAYKVHPEYPIIMVANRDEFHNRSAHPAHWWPDAPAVVAGKDLSAGGSWLASDSYGRMIALTNVRIGRSQQNDNALSRGKIVSDYIVQQVPADEYLTQLSDRSHLFNPFNLVVYDGNKLYYANSLNQGYCPLPPGIYGLSNAFLDTPWPKLQAAKAHLQKLILEDQITPQSLTNVLTDNTPYTDDLLPDTGIPAEMERLLSSSFITSPSYGTRCTSVFWQDDRGKCFMRETNWFSSGEQASEQDFMWNTQSLSRHAVSS